MDKIEKISRKILIPDPISHLNEEGMQEWVRICTIFYENDAINDLDLSMLFAYCNEFGKYLFFEKEMQVTGRIIKSPSGYPVHHPYESMAKKSLQAAIDIGKNFGLTPLSRSKMKSAVKKAKTVKFSLD